MGSCRMPPGWALRCCRTTWRMGRRWKTPSRTSAGEGACAGDGEVLYLGESSGRKGFRWTFRTERQGTLNCARECYQRRLQMRGGGFKGRAGSDSLGRVNEMPQREATSSAWRLLYGCGLHECVAQ